MLHAVAKFTEAMVEEDTPGSGEFRSLGVGKVRREHVCISSKPTKTIRHYRRCSYEMKPLSWLAGRIRHYGIAL